MLKPTRFDRPDQVFETFAAANDEKNDPWVVAEPFGCREHGLEIMSSAEVAGIGDDELIDQIPGLSQRIVCSHQRPDRLVIAPIGDDMDTRRRNAERLNTTGH